MTRKPLIAVAVPTETLSISTTSATANAMIPIKTSTMGMPDARRNNVDGRDCVKVMARRIASSSNVIPTKRDARVVEVVAVEPEVSMLNWVVRMPLA